MRAKRVDPVEVAVVGVLLAGTIWLGQLLHHNYVTHDTVEASGLVVAPAVVPASTMSGRAAPVRVRDSAESSLLLVLSTECPFCEQNMPAWRALAAELSRRGPAAARPIVLSVSEPAATEEFLRRHGLDLPVRIVDRAALPLLGVTGFPATVGVDARTGAVAAWTGVLGAAAQEAVLAWAADRRPVPAVR